MSPAGVNHSYHTQAGRWYKDDRVSTWETECLWVLKRAEKPPHIVTTITITFYFSNHRKNDIDGRIKGVLDVLQKGGIVKDDSQITELHVYKTFTSKDQAGILVLF